MRLAFYKLEGEFFNTIAHFAAVGTVHRGRRRGGGCFRGNGNARATMIARCKGGENALTGMVVRRTIGSCASPSWSSGKER